MKKTCLLFALLLLAVTLVACTPPEAPPPNNNVNTNNNAGTETPPVASSTFKLGGTGPLTGGAAIYGMSVKQGAELAVAEINALGGVQFELRYEDDEHNAEKAVNAYNALKDWGMQISFSSVTSTPGVATSKESFDDRMFGLTPSASSTAVTEGKDNIFQLCFADPNQGSATAQYIYDKKLATKIAVIYKNDDPYSKGIFETFEVKAKALGLDVVSATTFTEDSQTDFNVQIADAQGKGADFIFLPMYYTPASLIFNQAAAIGYAPTFFGVDGMDGILTLEGFDTSLAEGVMLLTPFSADATDQLTADFVRNYQGKYGEIPNQFAADGYDCVYAVHKAIQDSNGRITASMGHAEICEILVGIFTGNFVFDGVTGDGMTWDKNGQVTKEPKAVIIQNGEYIGLE
jgi:branched-chain amino acid transport system substrate-binding protein